jgi:hypothetical protein
METYAEFWIRMLELEKKVWQGPGTERDLKECERRIQELKDWVARGNKGLPPSFHPSCFAG